MKKLIGGFSLGVLFLVLLTVSMVSAFEVDKFYLDAKSHDIGDLTRPDQYGLDSVEAFDFTLRVKAVILNTALGSLGVEGIPLYNTDVPIGDSPFMASLFIRPFNIPGLEVYYEHRDTWNDGDIKANNFVGVRIGKGF